MTKVYCVSSGRDITGRGFHCGAPEAISGLHGVLLVGNKEKKDNGDNQERDLVKQLL